MKRNSKSILALVLALVMLLSVMVGCNQQKPVETKPNETQGNQPNETKPAQTQPVESKYPAYLNLDSQRPIVKEGEEITLKIGVVNNPSLDGSINDVWFVHFIEEVLNVNLEFEEIGYEERSEKITLTLNSGDLPDMMLVFSLASSAITNYGVDQGLLLPISDYMDETLTPNIISYFDSNPVAKAGMTALDGKIYGVPQLRGDTFGAGSTMPGGYWIFVDQDYMDAAGYESQPEDVTGFLDMLRDFKNVGDKIGVDAVYPILGDGQYKTIFKNAMGWMAYYGDDDSRPVWDVEEQKVVIPYAQDKYEEYVSILKTLYTEGLLHPDCFTLDRNGIKALQSEQRAGVIAADAPYFVAPDRWIEYNAAIPLKSEHNPDGLILANSNYATSTYVNISADTEYPELCMRLLDYLCSPEGLVYNMYGAPKGSADTLGMIDGYTIVNGKPDFGTQDDGYESQSDYTINKITMCWQYLADDNYILPYVNELAGVEYTPRELDWQNNEVDHKNYILATACQGKLVSALPNVFMTPEDSTRYSDLRVALRDYSAQEVAKFMTGERSMEEFGDFRKEMEELGLSEYVALVEKIYANIPDPTIVN